MQAVAADFFGNAREVPLLFCATLIVLAVLVLFAGVADSQEPAPAPAVPRPRLVVGLMQSPPFCIRDEDGSWSGISVELWQWIAADLGIDTEFRETTVTGLFDGLAPGGPLDLSIGALTITAEREDRLDFSQSFFLSGLALAVKTAPGTGGIWPWLGRLLVWNFWRIVAALIASLVLVALLIWALEHKGNPKEFGGDGKLHRGIGSALWWSAVTMTTVGYGDLAPRSPAGRLVAIAWMFVSLFLVSWFTASMASILTAERLDTGTGGLVVRGPDDLRRLHVAAIAGTSSEDYLRRHQIDYIRVPPKDLIRGAVHRPRAGRSGRRADLALCRTERSLCRKDHCSAADLRNRILRHRLTRRQPVAQAGGPRAAAPARLPGVAGPGLPLPGQCRMTKLGVQDSGVAGVQK